jgi:hypothetical protein
MPKNGHWIPSKKRRVFERGGGLASNPGVLFASSNGDGDGDGNEDGPSSSHLALPGRPELTR